MDKSIAKFLDFLDVVQNQLLHSSISLLGRADTEDVEFEHLDRRLREVKNFRKFLTVKKAYGDNHGEVFADFDILSEFLDASSLNFRDRHNLILFFIRKNCFSGILANPAILVNLREIEKSGIDQAYIDFIMELQANDKLTGFVGRNEATMSDFEREVFECIKAFSIDLTPYKNMTVAMKDHYLDKDILNAEDISIIRRTLFDMCVSCMCTEAFMSVASRKVKEEKAEVIVQEQKPKQNVHTGLITDKEFKRRKKIIKTTFDVYNRRLLRPITYEEVLYIAYLMDSLDYPEYDVINLFREYYKEACLHVYTVDDFLANKEKFAFYMEDDDYNLILECLEEGEKDPESREFWYSEASKLIRYGASLFSSKYTYEMYLVKSYQES